MRRTRLTLLTLAAVFGVLSLAPAVVAQPGPHGQRGGHGFHGGGDHHRAGHGFFRALRQLDLTEAQREEIHGILQARKDDGEGDRQALRDARGALHEAVTTTPLDEAAVRGAAADLAALEADAAVARAETYNAVYDVLTPEQREKLAEIEATAAERREERREDRRERRGARRGGA